MKFVILALALISQPAFANSCERELGSPGFRAEAFTEEEAAKASLEKCQAFLEDYGAAGFCAAKGCELSAESFVCLSQVILCE